MSTSTSEGLIFNTAASVAFGSVTGSFVTAVTNTNPLRLLQIANDTDSDIWVSTDGTNNHIYVPSAQVSQLLLAAAHFHIASNISIKHAGVAPTVGVVAITTAY